MMKHFPSHAGAKKVKRIGEGGGGGGGSVNHLSQPNPTAISNPSPTSVIQEVHLLSVCSQCESAV